MPTNNIVRQGTRAIAVTPSDSTDITGADHNNPAALYAGTGGDGSTVTLKSVPTGTFVPMQVTRVKAGNTTATDIIAIF